MLPERLSETSPLHLLLPLLLDFVPGPLEGHLLWVESGPCPVRQLAELDHVGQAAAAIVAGAGLVAEDQDL